MFVFTLIDGSKKSKGDSFALIGEPLIPNAFITPVNSYWSNKTLTSSASLKSIL